MKLNHSAMNNSLQPTQKLVIVSNARCPWGSAVRLAVWLVLCSFLFCRPVSAQLRLGSFETENTTVFTLAPREATRPLKIARKAIQDGDFLAATQLLGDLLAAPMLNEYLVADEKNWGRAISLRSETERLLGTIPVDQRGAYEEKYGVRANVVLQKAIAENDSQSIAQTSRLYFHTRAGLEATMLVGHDHLAQGRPAMAAVMFEKVAATRQGQDRFDPEATLLAAVSWSLNGSTERGEQLLRDLKQRQGNAEVFFLGKRVPLFDDDAPLENWLKEMVASTPLESHRIVNQWLVYRGDAQRNAESGSGFPLLSPRWSIRTVTDPVDESGIQAFQQKLIKSKLSPAAKVHPLAIGNTLVIRTDDRMYGVDANSGKRIWSYPPADVFRSREEKSNDAHARTATKLHQDKLRERLWLDALYGQISSDGDSIYLIPNPGISTDRDDWRSYQTQVYDEPTDVRLYNELKSLDLNQQGAVQWRVGGESGLDEPKLAKSFFLGAPLPIDDALYAICLQDKSVRLVVLNAETGKLKWARHLASTEESVTFREDRLRRLAGATPSESNGILICPTGLNAIVAVDLATESLSWGFQFKAPDPLRVDRLTDQLSKWENMWRDATVTLSGGAVIYTPIDSQEVYCLNLQTGDSLWSKGRGRISRAKSKAMHVETVRSGEIILTSSNRLRAIKLSTGKVSWELSLADYGLVSGRGYVSGDHCYIPTTAKKILKIDAATGNIDGVAITEKVLGNLICFRGDVISHAADHLAAYPRDEPSRILLANANQQQLDDHSLLSIQAQLHLLDQEYAQSVNAISRAYDLFPNSTYAKVLVQALQQLIDVDFAKAERISDRYQNLFEKEDLQRLLRGKVLGLVRLNRLSEAFETLIQIAETIDLKTPLSESDNGASGQPIESDTSIVLLASSTDQAESLAKDSANAELTQRLKQWLRWKFAEVFQQGTEQEKSKFKTMIADHLTRFQDDVLEVFHDRLRLFPANTINDTTRLKTAAMLMVKQQYVRATSLLAGRGRENAGAFRNRGVIDRAKGLLADLKLIENDNQDAPAVRSVAASIAALEIAIDKLTVVRDTGRNLLDGDYYESSADQLPTGRLLPPDAIEVRWNREIERIEDETSSNHFTGVQHFCDVVASDQPELEELSFRYSDEFREFQMFDSLGRFVHKIYLDPSGYFSGTKQGTRGHIFLRNGLLLLCIDTEVFAIDWEKFSRGLPALLWYVDNVKCSSAGIAGLGMNGISVLREDQMMCLSPFTGEVLWQRNQVSTRATLLEGEDSLTIWNNVGRTYDNVDRISGRFLACGEIRGGNKSASVAVGDLQLFLESKDETEEQTDGTEQDAVDDLFSQARRKTYESVELNLFDFGQQKSRWIKKLPYPAYSTLVDRDQLLVLTNDGKFSMIDMPSGELKFETKVPELANGLVSGISVNKFNGVYLVSVHSVAQQSEFVNQDEVHVTFERLNKSNAMINGDVVALDAETGSAVWDKPIHVQRFLELQGLPWNCPFLFLARRNTYQTSTTHTQVRVQMALVDLKTGKLKANELFKVPVRAYLSYQVRCHPQYGAPASPPQQMVGLDIGAVKVKFFLEDFPTPPQPVAALTNQGSYKRLVNEVAATPNVLPLAIDLQSLVEKAKAAQSQRIELGKEEARLSEIEMRSK